jgi:adenosylcobinamide kinase / adenosylcobinamide-phosphate guanylyltransferase
MLASLPAATLVLGGARSGKSRFGEELLDRHRGRRLYLATAEILDAEMQARVEAHRQRRDPDWRLIEEPLEIGKALVAGTETGAAMLVDCLTLWLANLMAANRDPEAEAEGLVKALGQCGGPVIFISNEVGLGIVPDNPLARAFRDEAGRLNQRMAGIADRVFFLAAGLPLTLK